MTAAQAFTSAVPACAAALTFDAAHALPPGTGHAPLAETGCRILAYPLNPAAYAGNLDLLDTNYPDCREPLARHFPKR